MEERFKEYMQLIYATTDHEDRLLVALRGFTTLFPFSRVHLCKYSYLDGTIDGLLDLDQNGTRELEIHDNIRNLTVLRQALRKQETVYSYGTEFTQKTPAKYTSMEMFQSYAVIVPLVNNGTVIGYACPGYYQGEHPISEKILEELTFYGQLIGNAIVSLNHMVDAHNLTNREIDVLNHLSWGSTTREISEYLKLSEFTVQDYVKSSIKKLDVQNRVHAVSKAIRLGIIK